MRHRLLTVLLSLSLLVGLFSTFAPSHTSAATCTSTDCNDPGQLFVKLDPANSSAKVTAKRNHSVGRDDTLSLTYSSSSGYYESKDGIAFTGEGCQGVTDSPDIFDIFTVTVTAPGIQGSAQVDMSGCDAQTINPKKVTIKTGAVSTKQNPLGGIAGELGYKNQLEQNTQHDCADNTTVTISGPTDTTAKITGHGRFDTGLTLKPGTYTVTATCTQDGSGGITTAGQWKISDTVKVTANNKSALNDLDGKYVDPPSTATGNNSGSGDEDTGCESQGGPLAWLMCQVVQGLAEAIDGIYNLVIQPLLVTRPLNLTSSDPTHTFQIWSKFRILGDIFLVIALLVIVFGESIGGGLIDAYAAKKILPRLLIAAILINLSIYIVAAAVDITNILGNGIADLLLKPFSNVPQGLDIKLGFFAGNVGLAALVGGGLWAAALGGALFEFLIAFVLLPAFLLFVAIMAVVLLRRALILLLVIFAPVAFALYCLPNTEKYFKQWWDLLLKTLLIYPLIAVLFALAKILAATMSEATQGQGVTPAIAQLLGVVTLFVPLFLIPFAFKIAGGIIGRVHEVLHGYGKRGHQAMLGNQNDPWSWRNRTRYGLQDRQTQLRERGVNWGRGGTGRLGSGRRMVGRALNYGNLQAQRSRFNKERSEMLEGQIATGDDSNIRDLFIAYDANATWYKPDGTKMTGGWFRRMDMDENGRALAGTSAVYADRAVGQMAHNKSLRLYGGDKSSVQSALYYEWRKTGFDEAQMGRIRDQYPTLLKDVGLNDQEGREMAVAIGFRHAGSSLSSKYTRQQSDGSWRSDDVNLVKEFSRQVDTYGASKQDVETFATLGEGYGRIRAALGMEAGRAADAVDENGVFKTGYYAGQSKQAVENARVNIERMADSLNPDQRMGGGGPRVVNKPDDGDAQVAGYGGVSNAPVEVQQAARKFYETVRGGQAPPPPRQAPGPGRPWAGG